MISDEPFQLTPGPQWFFVRVRGKVWGLAIEARSAFEAIDAALAQLTPGLGRSDVEAIWLHPTAISQILAAHPSPPAARPAKAPARLRGKRRSA
jgi:hypothetical protein